MGVSAADRFIAAFNSIEENLRERLGKRRTSGFKHALDILNRTDPEIRRHYDDLVQYSRLRNVMVHTMRPDYYLAEPNLRCVEHIERIRDALLEPPVVAEVMTVRPYSVHEDSTIASVITTFKQRGFMRCPVLGSQGISGLITAKSISHWLADLLIDAKCLQKDPRITDALSASVREVMPYCTPDEYGVVPRNFSVANAVDMFNRSISAGRYLQCLLVTANGGASSPLVGIIAPSDLPKLMIEDFDSEEED